MSPISQFDYPSSGRSGTPDAKLWQDRAIITVYELEALPYLRRHYGGMLPAMSDD